MPVVFKYMDDGMGFSFTGNGVVTGRELINATNEVLSSEINLKNYKYVLCDFTEVESMDVSNEEIINMKNQDINTAKVLPNLFFAICAERDIAFGFSRMWELYANETGWDIMVFRVREEAVDWIKDRCKSKFGINPAIS